MRVKFNPDQPFQSVKNAAWMTGFSENTIRRGCKDGTIPHIRSGRNYKVNVPLLLKQLDEQSALNVK